MSSHLMVVRISGIQLSQIRVDAHVRVSTEIAEEYPVMGG